MYFSTQVSNNFVDRKMLSLVSRIEGRVLSVMNWIEFLR